MAPPLHSQRFGAVSVYAVEFRLDDIARNKNRSCSRVAAVAILWKACRPKKLAEMVDFANVFYRVMTAETADHGIDHKARYFGVKLAEGKNVTHKSSKSGLGPR